MLRDTLNKAARFITRTLSEDEKVTADSYNLTLEESFGDFKFLQQRIAFYQAKERGEDVKAPSCIRDHSYKFKYRESKIPRDAAMNFSEENLELHKSTLE